MNKFEKGIVYFFSFIFFPIGLIVWITSFFNQNQQFKSVGRTALYIAAASLCIQILIGVLNFVVYTNITLK
ncbi:conserved hypothetical protein [Brevibacillus brevis NBRC 100599]|uniref:Group-specific protein n=1 Tax=Brevibacillus brevis (strain 47 / JCM 6285 / NBRC 100599) TaxID=358681 RepID=C0ZKP4_BREBN|nr:conserved hypothetical protein [Brevibacillus brevis NBRC 100599]